MGKLRKAEGWLVSAETALLVALLAVMVTLSFAQVVLRQAFGLGLLWADTFLRHAVLWVGFLGAARATVEQKHFAFEVLAERAGPRSKRWLLGVSNGCAALACVFLARASWKFLLDEKASGAELFRVAGIAVPAWLFAVIVPVGFALVGLHALARVAEQAAGEERP